VRRLGVLGVGEKSMLVTTDGLARVIMGRQVGQLQRGACQVGGIGDLGDGKAVERAVGALNCGSGTQMEQREPSLAK
jgi:hypothetical protein